MLGRDVVDRRIGELLGGEPCGGCAILVEGPIGVGRTTVLRAIAERGAALGYTVLSATGSRAERTVPLGFARQLAPRWSPNAARPDDRALGFETPAANLIDEVGGGDAPLMLVLDDLQLADLESLEFVLFLLRRLPAGRVLLVAAVQSPAPAAAESAAFVAELSRTLRVERVRIDRLSPGEVREYLTARLGAERAEELAERAVALSGGSPLLLDALGEDYAQGTDRASEGYARAVAGGVHRGGPVVTEVAAALAVLGETAAGSAWSAVDVARVAGVAREAAAAALRTLAAAGLPAAPFPDAAVRTAVLDRVDPARRADLHLAAARVAREAGRAPTVVVEHVLAAGDRCLPEAPWAVDALVEAADRAVLDDEPEQAARCLQVAGHHCPAGREAALAIRLAAVLWRVRPLASLPPLEEALHRGVTHDDAAEAVRQLVWHGRTAEATALLADLGRRGDIDGHVLSALETWGHHRAPGAIPAPHQPWAGRTREDRVRPETDPWLQSVALLADALEHGTPGRVEAHAEIVLRDARHGRGSTWSEEAIVLALEVLARAGRAADAVARGEQLLDKGQQTTGRARIMVGLASIALERGDLAAAVRWATEALQILPVPAWGIEIGAPLGVLVDALVGTGSLDVAAQWLVTTVPAAMDVGLAGLRYRQGRARFRMATGHPAAALADFTECGAMLARWGRDVADEAVAWRLGTATARLQLGEVAEARRIAQELASTRKPRTRASALRVLAAATAPDRRIGMLTEALELLESAGDIAGQAFVLSDLSEAYRAAEEIRTARLTSRRALHLARVAHVTPLVRELEHAVGSEQADADAPGAVAATLSESERRVAGLAVRGYSNREIGARLFITPSTVEQHLTRVYRKLGVRRRRDLPPDLWAEVSRAS
ncbi:LuxR C-terminal-related transcriptional regulator [Pseudonocardia oroxyli]|uniref:ATP-, maltotriose-and DNA-dependent transcriptional regulator MalT n=1 Tax=Pseudonocardia oroxyli TaxID=366584 RepID=A0A1G8CA14_PSEOR|nr:LuxR family transcriptional regulator [Pseudonocardia oroxyli]SDH42301.1 ATP-, maltotriose-and DNA-dependent transcriptional regulator MalT [Pseudonocardia oroxyli]